MAKPTKVVIQDEAGKVMATVDWDRLIKAIIELIKILFGLP